MAPITVTTHCEDVSNMLKKPSALGAIEIRFVLAEIDSNTFATFFSVMQHQLSPKSKSITIMHEESTAWQELRVERQLQIEARLK